MTLRRVLLGVAGVVLLGGAIGAGYLTRDRWLSSAPSNSQGGPKERPHKDSHEHAAETQQVKLSPQAQANLRLEVKPLKSETYWRTIQVPGLIVDRPAQSDRGVVAPVTGVVTRVHRFPGDTVKAGTPLFTVKLLSEAIHLTQSELFKTTQEHQITQEKKKRLAPLAASGAVSEGAIIDLDNQLRRLGVAAHAYRAELLNRGFAPEQIDRVADGKFISEIEVSAPKTRNKDGELLSGSVPKSKTADVEPSFEIQELKVDLGHQVQAGQVMGLLSNHQSLYIEGRAFRQETPLLEKVAREGWPVHVEFMEENESSWPPLQQTFTIRHVANTIDTVSRTFAFYIPLTNQSRSVEKDDRTLLLWRFRPGQKVRLNVQVEKMENVFVLPADAVVREGPEAFVFRQNGDLFDRKPVHVLYQDRQKVVVANDGSVPPGLYVAQNGATQINRVLRSGSGGLPPGFHMHADGSIHSNSSEK